MLKEGSQEGGRGKRVGGKPRLCCASTDAGRLSDDIDIARQRGRGAQGRRGTLRESWTMQAERERGTRGEDGEGQRRELSVVPAH